MHQGGEADRKPRRRQPGSKQCIAPDSVSSDPQGGGQWEPGPRESGEAETLRAASPGFRFITRQPAMIY